jgi:hypothetical protein
MWKPLRDAKMPRAQRLGQLATLEGVYVPSLYETELDPDSGAYVVAPD